MLALISLPSGVVPTRRGSLNISSACSSVTVSMVVSLGMDEEGLELFGELDLAEA